MWKRIVEVYGTISHFKGLLAEEYLFFDIDKSERPNFYTKNV